jgi:hypothetical protein
MRHIDAKAIRLVENGAVTITWVSPDRDAAAGTIDGATDTYQAQYSPAGMVCTCQAGRHHQTCSHAIALQLAVMYDHALL